MIETPRLILRPFSPEDAGDVLEDHDFRSRLEFAEFGNKFFHIFLIISAETARCDFDDFLTLIVPFPANNVNI